MTRDEIEALAFELDTWHAPLSGRDACVTCDERWPCPSFRAVAALRALAQENEALRARLRAACQVAVATTGADGPCDIEDAVAKLATENEALRAERAFIAEHFGRFTMTYLRDESGRLAECEVTVWNLEPRRSHVSFTDTFPTFDEALAHLMAQAAALDAAQARGTTT